MAPGTTQPPAGTPRGTEKPQAAPEKAKEIDAHLDATAHKAQEFIAKYGDKKEETLKQDAEYKKEIATMSASRIIEIASLENGLSVLQRAYFQREDGSDIDDIEKEERVAVKFQGNQNAERFIGAGHLLPPTIRCIEVVGKGIGIRKSGPPRGIGYFNVETGKYIPIFSDDIIRIIKDEQEFKNVRTSAQQKEGKWAQEVGSYTWRFDALPNKWDVVQQEKEGLSWYGNVLRQREHEEIIASATQVLWKQAVQETGTVDASQFPKVIDRYVMLVEQEHVKNPDIMTAEEWQKIVNDANSFKKGFPNLSPETVNILLSAIQKDHFPPSLLSPNTLEALEKGGGDKLKKVLDSDKDYSNKIKQYLPYVLLASAQYGVPPEKILAIIQKESGGDATAKNPYNSAYGLGQMIDSTWNTYGRGDRDDPSAQIDAMAHYLKDLHSLPQCYDPDVEESWAKAAVLYHTGPGGATAANLETYIAANPAIANRMKERTPEGYMEAVKEYYNQAA